MEGWRGSALFKFTFKVGRLPKIKCKIYILISVLRLWCEQTDPKCEWTSTAQQVHRIRIASCSPFGHFIILIIFVSHFVFAVQYFSIQIFGKSKSLNWIAQLNVAIATISMITLSFTMWTKRFEICHAIHFNESTALDAPNWVPKIHILVIIVIIIANIKLTSVTLNARAFILIAPETAFRKVANGGVAKRKKQFSTKKN